LNPIANRLKADYDKANKLVADSGGTLNLSHTVGSPPTLYVIEYHCPSLVKDDSGKLTLRNQHRVEITLGANYPLMKPSARMLTPVFNPHVFATNAICLGGVWSPSETLDTLILRIGALLQLDPTVLDPNSPANHEANTWVKNNKSQLPVGKVTFLAPKPAPKKIEWS